MRRRLQQRINIKGGWDVKKFVWIQTVTKLGGVRNNAVNLNKDGTKLVVCSDQGHIISADLTTPYDVSTVTNLQDIVLAGSHQGLSVFDNGSKMITVLNPTSNNLEVFNLGTLGKHLRRLKLEQEPFHTLIRVVF